MAYKYMRVTPDWHRLDTRHGTFFGHTKAEVFGKARLAASVADLVASERQRELALVRSHRSPVRR